MRNLLNNIDTQDKFTQHLSKAIDTLFISNSKKTSLGLLLGVVIKGIIYIILQFLESTLDVPYVFCICIGILLLHSPSVFSKHNIDVDLETQMHYLRKAQKYGNFSETEKRAQWRHFIELVHEKASERIEVTNTPKLEDKTKVKNS